MLHLGEMQAPAKGLGPPFPAVHLVGLARAEEVGGTNPSIPIGIIRDRSLVIRIIDKIFLDDIFYYSGRDFFPFRECGFRSMRKSGAVFLTISTLFFGG